METLDLSLDSILEQFPGSPRILRRAGIDFLRNSTSSLRQIFANSIDQAETVALDIEELSNQLTQTEWEYTDANQVMNFIVEHFHAHHIAELPVLVMLASKVERKNLNHPLAPDGIAAYLDQFQTGIKEHMKDEEELLFPALRSGQPHSAILANMLNDHNDIDDYIDKIEDLCRHYELPKDADEDWAALYKGVKLFIDELWEHVSMENNFLMNRYSTEGVVF